jgi:hypothetical protein
MNTQLTDFYYRNEGSIILLIPNTEGSQEWINENLCLESWQKQGNNIAVEPRSFEIIEEGIENDGLLIEEI